MVAVEKSQSGNLKNRQRKYSSRTRDDYESRNKTMYRQIQTSALKENTNKKKD